MFTCTRAACNYLVDITCRQTSNCSVISPLCGVWPQAVALAWQALAELALTFCAGGAGALQECHCRRPSWEAEPTSWAALSGQHPPLLLLHSTTHLRLCFSFDTCDTSVALEAKPILLAPLSSGSPPLTVLVHLPHVEVDLAQKVFHRHNRISMPTRVCAD